jgi:uncharacterized protein (DUF58 family)
MSRLLDPRIILSLKNLPLAAKTTVDGFMSGIHKTRVRGADLEFMQYRSYQPGDDLRWLDWKMYGRSDRFYIRESEKDSSISVRIIMDASASMDHADQGIKKIEYARYLAASLAYLANQQQDAVGLYVFQDNHFFSIPAKKDNHHLDRIYYQLEAIQPGGRFAKPIYYKEIFAGMRKRELVIFITDFYEEKSEILDLIELMVGMKNEILVFQLMGRNEFEMDFQGYQMLKDLETGETVRMEGTTHLREYREKMDQYLYNLRMKLLGWDIFYRLVHMDQPIEEFLTGFLNQRNQLSI